MYNHAPENYKCPICIGIKSPGSPDTLIVESDLVYKDKFVAVFINSFFIGSNPGHVIVVPIEHFESIYDLPDEIGKHIFEVAKKMALAMKKAYTCEGITTLQNNEPAGDQHAFHYHFHIFPRYSDDHLHLHMENKRLADPSERKEYATKLRTALES